MAASAPLLMLLLVAVALAAAPEPAKREPRKLQGDAHEMHTWWCAQAGHEGSLPCLMQQMRGMEKGPERDELQRKLRELHKPTGPGEDGRDMMHKMHDSWCELPGNADKALCVNWKKSADRRREAAEARAKSPNHKSEYIEMHTAYCDENPEHAETLPCLTHRLREQGRQGLEPEERAKLMEAIGKVPAADRQKQRDDMMKFWCEAPDKDRADSGVCLSWRKRKQLPDLHTPEAMKGLKEEKAPLPQKEAIAPHANMRAEMEEMHEWYCTQLDGTHESSVCARWRLRLKRSVEAYDQVAREKDEALVRELSKVQGDKMRELRKAVHEAKEAANGAETERLEAELKKVRLESQHEFMEMHRRWCTDGAGKDNADSPACKRWRTMMSKQELR